jgi:S1-C subfamily serine protease
VTSQSAGPGVLVVQVESGGPASNAGIVPGDRILSVAGHKVSNAEVLAELVAAQQPGSTVQVQVVESGGHNHTVTVTLGQFPSTLTG